MAERLELARDFDELREGMIIVAKPCDICGGSHRAILLGREISETRDPQGRIAIEECILIAPGAHTPHDCIVKFQVDDGFIFRVVDGMESAETTTRARKKERADGR